MLDLSSFRRCKIVADYDSDPADFACTPPDLLFLRLGNDSTYRAILRTFLERVADGILCGIEHRKRLSSSRLLLRISC